MEERTLNVCGFTCQALIHKTQGTPIVFLHGFSYNIGVWQRIGVLDLLVEKKIPFIALDMPYGPKSQSQPKNRDFQINVSIVAEALKSEFGDQEPIIVGASIGGAIALNYAAKYPVKGLFLIAPSNAFDTNELLFAYTNFHFPVRIVWGANDSIISGEDMRALADKVPNGKLLVYNGATHAAYQDQPEWFKTDLLRMYGSATIT